MFNLNYLFCLFGVFKKTAQILLRIGRKMPLPIISQYSAYQVHTPQPSPKDPRLSERSNLKICEVRETCKRV